MLVARILEIFGYIADEIEERLIKETLLSPARLYALFVAVAQCFAERETRGWHRQKPYADAFGANAKLALVHIVRQVC